MGERELVGLAGLFFLFILIGFRIPVALSMLVAGILGSFALSIVAPFLKFGPYILQFKSSLWNNIANYDLSVVPLFILMGFLAAEAGLSRDLFAGFSALFGRIRGGVAMAAIGACAGFGAVSGSSIATASTMSRVSLPELSKLKYDDGLATGTLAAGGTLGILIPPSVALVIYAIVVEASIVEMFQAAILPGLLAVICFITVIWLRVRLNPELAPEPKVLSHVEVKQALWRLVPVLLIFGTIIAGLGMGLFTPTPAAAMGVLVILIFGFLSRFFSRTYLTIHKLKNSILSTAKTAGMIYFILFAADVLKGFFSRSGLPVALTDLVANSGFEPYLVLALMLLLLIILGCFMESLSMILVVIPFFWPTLIELNGGDYITAADAAFGMTADQLKIWFGVLALVVVELGLITPSVGLNVFVIKSFVPDTPITKIFKGVMPFFAVEIFRVGLLLLFPALCLLLPMYLSG